MSPAGLSALSHMHAAMVVLLHAAVVTVAALLLLSGLVLAAAATCRWVRRRGARAADVGCHCEAMRGIADIEAFLAGCARR